jgi:hypothetical protein
MTLLEADQATLFFGTATPRSCMSSMRPGAGGEATVRVRTRTGGRTGLRAATRDGKLKSVVAEVDDSTDGDLRSATFPAANPPRAIAGCSQGVCRVRVAERPGAFPHEVLAHDFRAHARPRRARMAPRVRVYSDLP